MRCPKCNYNNRDGSATCNLCGELLHTKGANYYQRFRKIKRVKASAPAPAVPNLPAEGVDPRSLEYHLVCFPLDPVALDPAIAYSIGRSGDNDIIFPVGQVSRRHAKIEWRDDGFVLIDLGSHNGTIVNGEKITERKLHYGDQIKVGPYLLEYYVNEPGKVAPSADTKKMEATQDLLLGEGGYEVGPFSGHLADIHLNDICRLLNMTKKSGRLEVTVGPSVGEIHFLDGEIVDAQWVGMTAMQALSHMLTAKDGVFRFIRGDTGVKHVLQGPTSKLLTEALRLGSRKS